MRAVPVKVVPALFVAVIAVEACTQRLDNTVSPPNYARRDVMPASAGDHESVWSSYADAVPGFGGMYYDDDGDLVVALKDTTQAALAMKQFANRVGRSFRPKSLPPVGHPPRMRFVKAQFDYKELLAAKEAAARAVVPYSRMVAAIGIDEKLNKVRVGVVDGAAMQIVSVSAAAAIKPELLAVSTMSRAAHASHDTINLYTFQSPVIGGLRLLALSGCTVGLPVNWVLGAGNYVAGLITAEHCLDTANSRVSLVDSVNGVHDIGRVEFQGNWTYTCSHGSLACRHADVGLVQLQNGGLNYILGGVANAINGAQYLAVPPIAYNPTLDWGNSLKGPAMVESEMSGGGEVVGQWVSKLGVATGWTTGQIVNAAIDIQRDDDATWVVQSTMVQAGGFKGDSGGPGECLFPS